LLIFLRISPIILHVQDTIMAKYFDPNYLLGKFEMFSLPHIIALLIVAALNVVMVLALKKVDSKKVNRYFCYILSFILLAQEL
jgi:hypothetical protein